MIAQWMLAIGATATLLALAARALDAVLRGYGRPVRWVWVAALGGSVLLPLAGWSTDGAFPGGWLRAPRTSLDLSALLADAVVVESTDEAVASTSYGERIERVLIVGWLLASTGVFALYLGTWSRVGRSRRHWRAGRIDGTPVLVSGRGGPAVIGLLRPAIVVPAWLLEERDPARALVMLHEREHVRAGDHALLALAPLVAAAMPWNPAVWWQLRRLRLAVELDCDRRVLASGIEPRAYGTLLLQIAGRAGRPLAGAAALAEPRTFLERRIVAMTGHAPRHRLPRAFAFTGAAGVLALLACETAVPTSVNTPSPTHDVAETTAVGSSASRSRIDPADGDGDPIIILDGVVVSEGVIRMIDPENVARVEVLKGAAAATRYGREVDVVEIMTKDFDAASRTREAQVRLRALKETEAADRARTPAGARDVAGTIRPADGTTTYKIVPTTKAQIEESTERARIVEIQPTKVRMTNQSVDAVRIVDGAVFTKRADLEGRFSERVHVRQNGGFARELMETAVVILDGVTITDEADLAAIEPASIASVEIVKGAAAQKLGITDGRAVVRIETKR